MYLSRKDQGGAAITKCELNENVYIAGEKKKIKFESKNLSFCNVFVAFGL